jgi:2-dehydropantoate 2-reductase
MKIAVMGAGAVGCYYGGMLARAGHDVTLIARPQHVDEIRRNGLLLDMQSFRERVRVHAEPHASAVGGADLVLFCVKSTDTGAAAAAIAPHVSPDAVVLGLQNGVDNAERLQAALSQTVLPAVVYVGCELAAPGHVQHHGGGHLVVASSEEGRRIAALFEPAGVPVQLSDDVTGALWAKLVVNCTYNALSAITQLPYGRMVQGEGVEAMMRDAVDECLAVARASNVRLPADTWEAVRRIAAMIPDQYSSTAQDLARGRRTEIDHLNGYVVRRGKALGVPTPVNRVLHALVKLLEAKRATPVS